MISHISLCDSHILVQVESISETSALHQEAYILFYVRKGMFPWFSSLLEEATSGASPVSVLDNIDADCSTSGNGSSGDKFEIDAASQCNSSLLPEEPNKRCSADPLNSMNKKGEISPQRASLQVDVVMRCAPSATEITNPERPSTPPPRPKRMFPVDLGVFDFENLGKDLFSIVFATSVHVLQTGAFKYSTWCFKNIYSICLAI